MLFKHFVFNPFGVNCFVLSNDKGDAILIDPSVSNQREQDALATYIKDNNLTVRHLLNTHLHLDHVLGNAFVERTYGIKAEAHQEDEFLLDLQEEQSTMYGMPFEEAAPPLGDYIAEGDTVGVEGIELQVIHVAGHSPGGVAFYLPSSDVTLNQTGVTQSPSGVILNQTGVTLSPTGVILNPVGVKNLARQNTPPLLFSGDILFAGSMGRSDLFGGDEEALISGIKRKLLTLPPETYVFPGHGPSTTIEDERENF